MTQSELELFSKLVVEAVKDSEMRMRGSLATATSVVQLIESQSRAIRELSLRVQTLEAALSRL